jgi:hypothetical protein
MRRSDPPYRALGIRRCPTGDGILPITATAAQEVSSEAGRSLIIPLVVAFASDSARRATPVNRREKSACRVIGEFVARCDRRTFGDATGAAVCCRCESRVEGRACAPWPHPGSDPRPDRRGGFLCQAQADRPLDALSRAPRRSRARGSRRQHPAHRRLEPAPVRVSHAAHLPRDGEFRRWLSRRLCKRMGYHSPRRRGTENEINRPFGDERFAPLERFGRMPVWLDYPQRVPWGDPALTIARLRPMPHTGIANQ